MVARRIGTPDNDVTTPMGLLLLVGCLTRLRAPQTWFLVVDRVVSGAADLLILLAHGPWQLVPA